MLVGGAAATRSTSPAGSPRVPLAPPLVGPSDVSARRPSPSHLIGTPARVSSQPEVPAMGVLEDLARARTDYERGDWASRARHLVRRRRGRPGRRRPARRGPGRRTSSAAGTRRSTATSGRSGCARTTATPPPASCARSSSRCSSGTAASRRWRPAGPLARSGCSTGSVPMAVEAGYVMFLQSIATSVRATWAPRPRRRTPPPRSGVATASATWSRSVSSSRADRDLLRPGGRGARPAGRGDGRGRGRRGLPRGVRQRLLHRDRGLPGDRRLRPGRRVELGPASLVRLAAPVWSRSPASARSTADR